RFEKIEARRDSTKAAVPQGHGRHTMLGAVLEVVSRREGFLPCPADDRHPTLGISRELVERGRELEVGRRMERVHDLGSIDGNPDDTFPLLVVDELIRHEMFLLSKTV